jgi:hypothetical protein
MQIERGPDRLRGIQAFRPAFYLDHSGSASHPHGIFLPASTLSKQSQVGELVQRLLKGKNKGAAKVGLTHGGVPATVERLLAC